MIRFEVTCSMQYAINVCLDRELYRVWSTHLYCGHIAVLLPAGVCEWISKQISMWCTSTHCIRNPEIALAITFQEPRMLVSADHSKHVSCSGHIAQLLQLDSSCNLAKGACTHGKPNQMQSLATEPRPASAVCRGQASRTKHRDSHSVP